jgi:dCMP deaminase
MEETTRKAAEKAFVSFKEGLVVWATLVAVLLGALAIFAPLGASYVEKYLARQEQQDLEQKVEKKVGELYDSRLKTLSDEVEKLKSQQKAGPGGESRRKTLGMSDDHSRFMNLAEEVARGSNCVRRSVGAVVVRHGQVVSKGWNGLPGSVGNCRDAGCPRCINGGDTGSGYENCLCIHAEQHAIADAARLGVSTEDSTMYVNLRPCMQCLAIAKAAGVRRVFFHGADWKYPDETEAAYSALASQFEAFGCVDVKEQAELAG